MRCVHEGISNKGNEFWGGGGSRRWLVDPRIHNNIIQFCRKAFGKRYRNYWILDVYFDDKYMHHTDEFFSEVGVELYPKLSKVPPHADSDTVWSIAHKDIWKNINHNVKPKCVIIKGVRYKDDKCEDGYREVIKSVKECAELPQSGMFN